MRSIGFYISDFTDSGDGFTPSCLDELIENNLIRIVSLPKIPIVQNINITSRLSAMLEDLLVPNLKLVFCGTAAGKKSAELKQYYAGRNNRFWDILFVVKLTPRLLMPSEYKSLLNYGIGLTDIAKYNSGCDRDLKNSDFDVETTKNKILQYKPKYLCFNGKTAAKNYFQAGCKFWFASGKIR
jgi:TDG/mug DNA glycosylase family protein